MTGSRTAAALLASLMLAAPALADPKPPTEKDKQLANDLVKKAIAKSQAGDHNAAIELYLQAFTIVPNSILLSNVGAEYQQSDRPQQALRYFCMYLEKDPNGTSAPYAAAQARSLQVELGNTDVDERNVCAKPKVRPRPRPEPKEVKDPPPGDPEPRPRDPEPVVRDVRKPEDKPEEKINTLKYAGIGAGIGGLIALGVGAYAGARASSISNELTTHDRTKPWPNDVQELQKNGQSYENVQIGALIAGGVMLTAGVVLYVVSRSDAQAEHANDRTVRLSPTTNGFVVYGRF
ncbi:MAG TPA: tetratricopeptide repeat protein [Kofleriaceae bacterium]